MLQRSITLFQSQDTLLVNSETANSLERLQDNCIPNIIPCIIQALSAHPASEECMHKHHTNVGKQINSLSAYGFSISQASLTLTGDPVVRKKDIASSNKTVHSFFVYIH